MKVIVRQATKSDIPYLFQLVKQLAEFEKMPSSVTVTLDEYYEEFENDTFGALIAEEDGNALGMALYYKCFSTWKGKMMHLEDFIVDEAYRSKGVGQKLFDHIQELAKSEGYKLLRWEVLDWNVGAQKFYHRNGAIIEKCWWTGKIIFD